MTTNGHAALPNPQPGDLAPERRPVKRTLFVEEEDNGLTNVWEATDEDMTAMGWCKGHDHEAEVEESEERANSFARELHAAKPLIDAVRRYEGFTDKGVTAALAHYDEVRAKEDARWLADNPKAADALLGTTPSGEAVRGASSGVTCAYCDRTWVRASVIPPHDCHNGPGKWDDNPHASCRCEAPDFEQIGLVQRCRKCRRFRQPDLSRLAADKERYVDGVIAETLKGEPVRMVGAERAEVEKPSPLKTPSERIVELAIAKLTLHERAAFAPVINLLCEYLDERERLGRGGA